ncbi:MAG: DUF6531 domain-containing protein, partial [Limnochordia bacterium]|nr:DUF6531 domain-containing protein [Limnochordia bacterium]
MKKGLFRWLLLVVLFTSTLIVSVTDYCTCQELTYSMDGPSSSAVLHWQRQTDLSYSDVETALTLSRQYNVNPVVIFALREMNIEDAQIEGYIARLSHAYEVLSAERKDVVDALAHIFGIRVQLAHACIDVGASPAELLYILYVDHVSGEPIVEEILEAVKLTSWAKVREDVLDVATKAGLTRAFSEQESEDDIRIASVGDPILANPATGYDSNTLNPFQPYFADFQETINPATGSLILTQTDLVLPGRGGLDLEIKRVYSSNAANAYQQKAVWCSYWVEEGAYSGEYVEEYHQYFIIHQYASIGHWAYADWFDESDYCWYYPVPMECTATLYNNVTSPPRPVEQYPCNCVDNLTFWEKWYETYCAYADWSENYLTRRYGLGLGWSFGFPSVEYVNADDEGEEQVLLHLGAGRVFEVDEHSPSRLKRHPLQDMVFSRGNSSLRLKNGTTYYFDSAGRLTCIEDRYGNEIQFTYGSGSSRDRIAEIEDTVGRRVCFDYSNPNKVVLTVRDQSGASQGTIEYHLQDVASGYPPAKKLTKVVDNLGREISFDYDLI